MWPPRELFAAGSEPSDPVLESLDPSPSQARTEQQCKHKDGRHLPSGPPNGMRKTSPAHVTMNHQPPLRMLTVGRHFFARALDGVFPSLHRLSPTFPCSAETMAASGAARAPPEMRERFRGSLLGLAVGDAVGATVDGMKRGSFTAITDMVGGGNYRLLPGQVRTCSGATPLSDRSNPSTRSLYNLYLACIHFTLHCSLASLHAQYMCTFFTLLLGVTVGGRD